MATKLLNKWLLPALLVGAGLLLAGIGWAQDAPAGEAELRLLELFLTGNYGLTLGLGVVIFGIFQIVQQNVGGGILLIVVGALIVLAPGIYNGTRMIVCPITALLGNNIQC